MVQSFNCALKTGKLHHSVRDLTPPQRNNTLVKPRKTNIKCTVYLEERGEGERWRREEEEEKKEEEEEKKEEDNNLWEFLNFSYPANPSSAIIFGIPSLNVFAKPGCVWIRTLAASNGHNRMSAKNSAEADDARYKVVLQRKAFS